MAFNKPCDRSEWERAIKPRFFYFGLTYYDDGELKVKDYKEAWQESFKKATIEGVRQLKALPNFDAEVFEEITGIKI